MKVHPWSWLIWFATAAVLSLTTRNPYYSLILLVSALLATQRYGNRDTLGISLGRISLVIILFSTIYAVLFIHIGDHVLLRLPDWPLIGGAITLEAAADGVRNGIVLITLIAIFLAFNSIIPVSTLVRLIPSSLKDIGVVLLVAVTYVPETRSQLRRIQEAQAIRGHEIKGLKDWRPVLIPLLIAGFERSLRLSETMVARGYGSTGSAEHGLNTRGALLLVAASALIGWILLIFGFGIGWVLLTSGFFLLVFLVLRNGGQAKRTQYHRYTWSLLDIVFVAVSITALILILVPMPFIDRSSLAYNPYPNLAPPLFNTAVGVAMLLMVVPLIPAPNPGTVVEKND